MKPPKRQAYWAIWLDWPRINKRNKSGHWYPGGANVPHLFATKREARRHAPLDFERVVRVTLRTV